MLSQAPHASSTSSPTYLIHHPLLRLNTSSPRSASFNVSRVNGVMNMGQRWAMNRRVVVSASEDRSSSSKLDRKRKVVEHICLLKAKENLSDEEEKDMLDYLYTTQYQMGGIVAISLGRISEENLENYTHAVYIRFQRKEDLAKFYENPFYLEVLKEHVMPYCHGLFNIDFEAEVEDDILPIFRKGEEFNYGLEFVLLISFVNNAIGGPVEHALASFARLTIGFPSLIVQSTQGLNLNLSNKEYTHGIVIRFRSCEAFELFMGSSEYQDIQWALRSCSEVLRGFENAFFLILFNTLRVGVQLLNSSIDKADKVVRSDEVVCVGFVQSCCTSSEVAVFIFTEGKGRRVAVYEATLMLLS